MNVNEYDFLMNRKMYLNSVRVKVKILSMIYNY